MITHYGKIKVRVVGSGNLRAKWLGYDDIRTETLVPLPMSTLNFKQELRLSNFVSERAMLRLEVTAIDEYFKVNSITLYTKPIYTEYPQ